jgi:dienelactone hydrolase
LTFHGTKLVFISRRVSLYSRKPYLEREEVDMRYMISMAFILALMINAEAKLKTETVEYTQGDTALQGVMVYDTAWKGRRPAVLVVHEWWGLNDYAVKRAADVAKLGYVAFAADIYGKGVRPATMDEAGKQAGLYRGDRALMRERVNAGLEVLRKFRMTDPKRMAAIGFCFGGTTVLELARSGARVAGVVSFHGGLDSPNPADGKNIKSKVLVLHGADDPFTPPDQVAAFQDEMRKNGVDWEMVYYGGAVHGFTNPANGGDNSKGLAYNARAERKSWDAMKMFFREIFR